MNKNISDLTEKSTASGTDYLIIEDDIHTYKISKANLYKNKIDEVTISGNTLTFKADGIVVATITLPSSATGGSHSHNNKTVLDTITEALITSWNNKSDFSGSYNDLINKPTIPTQTSQLTNNSGFLTSIPSEYITESDLEANGYTTQAYVDSKITTVNYQIGTLSSLSTTNKTDLVQAINELYQMISKITDIPTEGEKYGEITISATTMDITEGNNASFTVRLASAPTNNQVVSLSVNNSDCVLNKTSLTFTPSNYNTAQTVQVNVNEDSDYSNETATITITSPNVPTKTIVVNMVDNDTEIENYGEITLSSTTMDITEGNNASFTVRLASAPTNNQLVSLSVNNSDCVLDRNSLTFTPSNYSTAQTVRVSVNEDSDYSNETATVTITSPNVSTKTITVNITDNDIAPENYGEITLSPTTMNIVEGNSASFTVRLASAPTNNQVVNLSANNSDCVLDKDSLTFTPSNYSTAQTVQVSISEDSDYSNETATITVASPNVSSKTITVNITDNDTESTGGEITSIFDDLSKWFIDNPSNATITTMSGNNLDIISTSGDALPYTYFTALTVGSTYKITCDYIDPNLIFDFYTADYGTQFRVTASDFTNNSYEFTATHDLETVTMGSTADAFPITLKITNMVFFESGTSSGGDTNVAVQGISLNKATASLNVGDTVTLNATISPSNATNKTVTWSCNNSNVTLNSNGLTCTVVGATVGTSIITAKTVDGNKTATCNITVNSGTVAVQNVTLNNTTTSVTVGNTMTLTATINPSNATNKNVTWSKSNNNIDITPNGLNCTIISVAAGSSSVTVTTADGNYTATCNIDITASSSSTETTSIFDDLSKWYIDNSASATITTKSGNNLDMISNGGDAMPYTYFTALTVGNKYKITCDYIDPNLMFEFYTGDYSTSFKISASDFTNNSYEFTATSALETVTINSSASSLPVTLKITNMVFFESGTSSGGDTNVAVQGISLNKATASLNVGDTVTLNATIIPSNATNKNVLWSVDNSNATLSQNGLTCVVSGAKVGTSKVTVKTVDGNYTVTCTVTITASSSSGGGNTGDYSTTLETPALVSAVDDGNYDIGYFNEGTLNSSEISGNVYYLSSSGSDTSGSGTSSSPWKSINKVRTYVDSLSSKPSKVTILMADGDYNVTATQIIRGTTFGTSSCPVEIRGIGNKTKITTGTKLTNYTQTTMNGKTCYMYDLSSVSGWNSGNNVFEPTKQDSVPDYDQIKNDKYQCNVTDMPFVSVNDEKLWLASYPNKQDLVFQTGVTGNDNGASGFSKNQTVVIPSGTLRTKLNSFSQLSNISSTNNKVFVQMYWTAKYFAETLLIRGYNSSNGTITMSAGCLNEDTSPYSSQKFRFYNIKEQLNEESTYWIDYDNNKLYIIPPTGTNMSTAEVVLSHIKNSTTASNNTLIATNSANQTYVTFERINFCDHRGNVFLGTSSNKLNGVKFYKCRFVNIGRSVFGCNTTYGHYAGTGGTDIVTNCEWRRCKFGNIGEFALFIVGSNRNTSSLYSDNNKVYNCVFNKGANTGTYLCNKVHFIYYYGCGMEVKGSKFANHPGQAILWRANDFIINDNIFYQNTWSEADAGTIYSGCDWSFRGVEITNNKFYAGYQADRQIGSDYSGTVGVYLDDLYSAATVKNNYIEGFQKGILVGGGRDNIIENNTIKDCGQGLIFDDRGLTWDISNFEPNMLFTNSVPWSNWISRYPALSTLSSDINNNVKPYGNTIKNNACTGCYYNISIDSQVSSLGTVSGNTNK